MSSRALAGIERVLAVENSPEVILRGIREPTARILVVIGHFGHSKLWSTDARCVLLQLNLGQDESRVSSLELINRVVDVI